MGEVSNRAFLGRLSPLPAAHFILSSETAMPTTSARRMHETHVWSLGEWLCLGNRAEPLRCDYFSAGCTPGGLPSRV